jgi:ElaB/YqjD/DUF883 family membrane-anchored ribosome-binding protein
MENSAQNSNASSSDLAKSSMLDKASSSAHTTVNSIANAVDDAARKAKPAIDQVAAMAHDAVDKAVDVAAPAADWLMEQGNNLTITQKKLVANTSAYISANPLKAIGFAVAAGFLLSRVLRS